jgi:hypothetical protein
MWRITIISTKDRICKQHGLFSWFQQLNEKWYFQDVNMFKLNELQHWAFK